MYGLLTTQPPVVLVPQAISLRWFRSNQRRIRGASDKVSGAMCFGMVYIIANGYVRSTGVAVMSVKCVCGASRFQVLCQEFAYTNRCDVSYVALLTPFRVLILALTKTQPSP